MTAVKITGLDRLNRKLGKLPPKAESKLEGAVQTSADDMVRLATVLAPVDDGDLRKSIKQREMASERAAFAVRVSAGDARAYYASFVEFGTRFMAARPFFWPAWRSVRRRYLNRVRRASREAAREIIK